jgi:hypothetical protein
MLNKTVKGKKMKLSTLVTIVSAVMLTACASKPQVVYVEKPAPQYQREYTQQSAHPYAMTQEVAKPVNPAPRWFTNLPQDTPDMIFAAGTAQSTDEQMAYDKARLQAERKLVEMMTARVKSSTKSYRSDNGDTMSERTDITIQKNAEGDLIGAQRVDSQATFDGKRYKVYVLLRLPLAENNSLRKERESAQLKRETALRAQKAQQDLDDQSERNRQAQERADERMKKEIGIREPATVKEPTPPAVKGPETVPTSEGELKLLDVDNKEYKSRRAEAMTKEGAVVGNSTMR